MPNVRWLFMAGCLAATFPAFSSAADPVPEGSPYQIVLRSRNAVANPVKTRDAQTGGGAVLVEQPEPNTIMVSMIGAAVAGSECHGGSSASVTFELDQVFDIMPTRKGVRAPRVGMVGRVVGTLQVTDGKCCRSCGSAEHAAATACVSAEGGPLLSIAVKPANAGPGNYLSLNNKEGPVEAVAVPGPYVLKQSFTISATQGKGVFYRQYAVADFDPAPQLDAFWGDALAPFRAVPRKDFGFRVVVRVVEDAAETK